MAIHFTTTTQDNTLFVTASGFDENLAQVLEYGMAIITACTQTGITHILCDERELEYRLDTFDTFQAAEFIAANAPHVGRIAIVCNPKFIASARFWEDVAVNRGLTARMFKNVDDAIQWLKPPASPGSGS